MKLNAIEVIKQIKEALKFNEDVQFESALLKDGTEIRWNGELAQGVAVVVVTAEGEIPAPDTTHELEDGTLITTLNGTITEIVEPTLEETPQEMSDDLDPIAKIVKEISPELSDEIASKIASKVNETIKSTNDNPPIEQKESDFKSEEMQKEINALKDGFRKMLGLIESFSEIPSHDPLQKPHTPSKKQTQEEQLLKFSNALNKIKK